MRTAALTRSFTAAAGASTVELFTEVELKKLELVKRPSMVNIGCLASGNVFTIQFFAGEENPVPESPVAVQTGLVAGQLPKIPDDIQYTFAALELDQLSAVLRYNAGSDAVFSIIVNLVDA